MCLISEGYIAAFSNCNFENLLGAYWEHFAFNIEYIYILYNACFIPL